MSASFKISDNYEPSPASIFVEASAGKIVIWVESDDDTNEGYACVVLDSHGAMAVANAILSVMRALP